MKKALMQGLIKAAETTDSIIITNGNNKLVGKAFEEYASNNLISLVGVCPFHKVAFKERLMVIYL
jgi:hypothetical protein